MKYLLRRTYSIDRFDFLLIKKKQDFKCNICGIKEGTVIKGKKGEFTIQLTQDHIIPKSKGGKTEPSNIQALCFGCNRKKGNKIVV